MIRDTQIDTNLEKMQKITKEEQRIFKFSACNKPEHLLSKSQKQKRTRVLETL